MTLAMCAHIEFPANDRRASIEVRKVAGIEVRTSIHDLCQSATITLPRNVPQFRAEPLRSLIRRGDAVTIRMGYDGELTEVDFRGFVSSVSADVPILIECRDGLWKLLQQPFSKAYAQAHVPTMVRDLVGDAFRFEAMDASVGAVRIEKARKADAFKALKDEFGLVTYLKGDKVFCGVVFDTQSRTAVYDLERNVKSSNLRYRLAEEVSLKVSAKSLLRDGSSIEVEVGDPDGEVRTLNYYGITSKAELEKVAKADIEKYKYDGFEGSLEGFGIPFCQFGDKVELRSTEYPERNGHYLAESVTVSFGPDGYSREITLAQQWTR